MKYQVTITKSEKHTYEVESTTPEKALAEIKAGNANATESNTGEGVEINELRIPQ